MAKEIHHLSPENLVYLAIDEDHGRVVLGDCLIMRASLGDGSFVSAYIERVDRQESRRNRLARDPVKQAAIQRARRRVGDAVSANSPFSLAKLRLQAGLSQSMLATLLRTQQPAIARLEKGETDPTLSTINKLAHALGVEPDTVLQAFKCVRGAATK